MNDKELQVFVEMGIKYKNVFSSSEGQVVLRHIIWDILGTFRTNKQNERDMALSNAGSEILNYVACSDGNVTSDIVVKGCIDAPAITINKGERK